MIVSAYTDRIYKKDLDKEQNLELSSLLINFSHAKISCYSKKIHNKIEKFNTTYIRDTFKYNTYYANMVIKEVNQCISSNEELQKMYIANIEDKIQIKEKTIEKLNTKLSYWREMKKYCIELTNGKIKNLKFVFPFSFYEERGKIYVKNNKNANFNLYDFEVQVVTKNIKRRRHQIYKVKLSIKKLQRELEKIKAISYISCFGSKSFFKKQFTVEEYKNNHAKWKREFYRRRHWCVTISGCGTWVQGNGCVRYNSNKLSIMKMKDNIVEGKTYSKSQWFDIPVTFKYNADLYFKAIVEGKSAVAYQIKDYNDYYIITATFDVQSNNKANYSLTDGVVSIDTNYNHFALCNIDKHGNYLNNKIIHFNIKGKTSEQITKTLEKAALEVIKYCENYHKPLVREDLQKISSKNYGCRRQNERISQFAYNKMITTIDRCAFKRKIEVYKISPAYTSQFGKIKYMRQLGLSIHQSAAFCIGRRFLFTKQKKRREKTYPTGKTEEIKKQMKQKIKKDKDVKTENKKKKKELRKLAKKKTISRNNFYIEKLSAYESFGDYKKICIELKKVWNIWFYQLHTIPVKTENYKSIKKYVAAVKEHFMKPNNSDNNAA